MTALVQSLIMMLNGGQIIAIIFWLYAKFGNSEQKIDFPKVALIIYSAISFIIILISITHHLPILKQIIIIIIESALIYSMNKKIDFKK